MRLINIVTRKPHQFFDDRIPSYAIVSHTWETEDKELTFQDWLYIQNQTPQRFGLVRIEEEVKQLKSRPGYTKIDKACQKAQQDKHDWLWIDTVCIDKTNSAEVSEAINSMYKWYSKAKVCYAFLADVEDLTPEEDHAMDSRFRRSEWFKRGWTLQELIALENIEFYSKSWKGKPILYQSILVILKFNRSSQ